MLLTFCSFHYKAHIDIFIYLQCRISEGQKVFHLLVYFPNVCNTQDELGQSREPTTPAGSPKQAAGTQVPGHHLLSSGKCISTKLVGERRQDPIPAILEHHILGSAHPENLFFVYIKKMILIVFAFFMKYCYEYFPICFIMAQKNDFVMCIFKVHQMSRS